MLEWISPISYSLRKFLVNKILLLFFTFFSLNCFSQTREYAVKVVGIRVGTIYATKTNIKDSISYSLASNVDVNFLVYRLKVDYKVKSLMLGGQMINSSAKVKSNRGNFRTLTKSAGKSYSVVSERHDKNVTKNFSEKIHGTFASMFFEEPKNLNRIYAEFYANFIEISKPSAKYYKGVLDENIDEFYYENGVLVKLIKKNPITDMVIKYQPPSNKKKSL
jgi:hypothetical protein